jgi:formylglycine-generating enzyme required for sulfatase activity
MSLLNHLVEATADARQQASDNKDLLEHLNAAERRVFALKGQLARPRPDWPAARSFASELISGLKLSSDCSSTLGNLARLADQLGNKIREVAEEVISGRPPLDDFADLAILPKMIIIPHGWFVMGSTRETEPGRVSQRPQHRVWINRRFAMGQCPVTFEEYDYLRHLTFERWRPFPHG